jgi:UDP-glucose 4-epimerase
VRAVVTGGAGFIGSTLVDALVARGDDVHVVDDLSAGRREHVADGVALHVLDVAEPLSALFAEARPDVVFHLAAQIDVRASVSDPVGDARTNVIGTLSVLEAAREHGAQVVFTSTGGAIYGECESPAPEDAPRLPMSPYGTSKLSAEEYLATWNRLYGTRHVSLRLGNVYGPRQDPHGEAGVVAIFLSRIRDGKPATIFGDGRQTRDFTYVADVIAATRAAAEAATPPGRVFNIGGGDAVSVNRALETLAGLAGRPLDVRRRARQTGDVRDTGADTGRARAELGFSPQTGLETGLAAELAWVREHAIRVRSVRSLTAS